MLELVRRFGSTKCQEPLDKVYAFHSLLNKKNRLNIDYTCPILTLFFRLVSLITAIDHTWVSSLSVLIDDLEIRSLLSITPQGDPSTSIAMKFDPGSIHWLRPELSVQPATTGELQHIRNVLAWPEVAFENIIPQMYDHSDTFHFEHSSIDSVEVKSKVEGNPQWSLGACSHGMIYFSPSPVLKGDFIAIIGRDLYMVVRPAADGIRDNNTSMANMPCQHNKVIAAIRHEPSFCEQEKTTLSKVFGPHQDHASPFIDGSWEIERCLDCRLYKCHFHLHDEKTHDITSNFFKVDSDYFSPFQYITIDAKTLVSLVSTAPEELVEMLRD